MCSNRPASEQSTAKLVQQATEQVSRLVRDQLTLARLEIAEKMRHGGVGVGLASAGGVFALCGIGTLIAAVVLLLALAMPAWLAALLVAIMSFVVGGSSCWPDGTGYGRWGRPCRNRSRTASAPMCGRSATR